MSDECNIDPEMECRIVIRNLKKLQASSITTVEELSSKLVFMLDTDAEANLIKARNPNP